MDYDVSLINCIQIEHPIYSNLTARSTIKNQIPVVNKAHASIHFALDIRHFNENLDIHKTVKSLNCKRI